MRIRRASMRLVLVLLYLIMLLLLLPWAPVAVWCMAFVFGDPMPDHPISWLFGKVIPSMVLVYPLCLIHAMVASWRANGQGQATTKVLIKALYPLLLIIPVLMLVVAFIKQ